MLHKHRLRLIEVPVTMRERATGRSSIRGLRTVYYMAKVMLAILVGAVPPHDDAAGGRVILGAPGTPLKVSLAAVARVAAAARSSSSS